MKIFNIEQKTPEWDIYRAGRITGTKLKGLMGRTREEWENLLVAERLSMTGIEETDMARGNRLEPEAVTYFENKLGVTVERIGFTTSDENKYIASSPDGLIFDKEKGKYTEALEVKALSGKRHVGAFFEKLEISDEAEKNGVEPCFWEVIPDEYKPQCLQYFIVNDDLETLYFSFYCDVIHEMPMILIRVKRVDIESDIANAKKLQIESLATIEEKLEKILFFSEEQEDFLFK